MAHCLAGSLPCGGCFTAFAAKLQEEYGDAEMEVIRRSGRCSAGSSADAAVTLAGLPWALIHLGTDDRQEGSRC